MAVNGLSIQTSSAQGVLPAATGVIQLADSHDRAAFAMVTKMKEEPMDVETLENKEEVRLSLSIANDSGYCFIALIHPIQWTIALPVGATGPAKR